MKNPPKVVAGQRVRVVVESYVTSTGTWGFRIDGNQHVVPEHSAVVSVEVLPPPVEVFRDGTVQDKVDGNLYTVYPHGYFNHSLGKFYEATASLATDFTSKYFQRVTWTVGDSA